VQHTHHVRCHCRVSFFAKLRFVSWHDTESLLTAEIQQCLWGINADAEVLRSAQCKLNPARYGRADNVMTASLSSCTQQVLAVDSSELDVKLGETQVVWPGPGKNTSGMALSQDASPLCSHCSPSLKV